MLDAGTDHSYETELARTLAHLITLSRSLSAALENEGPAGLEPDEIYEYLDRRQVYFESLGDIANPTVEERELCRELLQLDAALAERLTQRTREIQTHLARLKTGRKGLHGYRQERPATTFDTEG